MDCSNKPEFLEGQSGTRPPYINGDNFGRWKIRMETFLGGYNNDMSLWDVTEEPFVQPLKDPVTNKYRDEDKKWMAANKRALNLIFCALKPEIFDSVMHLRTAHEVWKKLEITHEGTTQVKKEKIHLLV